MEIGLPKPLESLPIATRDTMTDTPMQFGKPKLLSFINAPGFAQRALGGMMKMHEFRQMLQAPVLGSDFAPAIADRIESLITDGVETPHGRLDGYERMVVAAYYAMRQMAHDPVASREVSKAVQGPLGDEAWVKMVEFRLHRDALDGDGPGIDEPSLLMRWATDSDPRFHALIELAAAHGAKLNGQDPYGRAIMQSAPTAAPEHLVNLVRIGSDPNAGFDGNAPAFLSPSRHHPIAYVARLPGADTDAKVKALIGAGADPSFVMTELRGASPKRVEADSMTFA